MLTLTVCPPAFATDSAPETVPSDASDAFAEIGKKKYPDTSGVLEGKPLDVVTNVVFPWDPQPAAEFATADKIDTQEKLDSELQRMRERYAPFMADLAPAISARPEVKLEKFDWRLETKDDRADIANALEGKGEWKQVRIPHYGGPINDAVSYYRTTVNVDANLLKSGTPYIHFQGADYIAEVYCNGKLLGRHEGLFDPFEFNLAQCLKPGENVLVVRLTNQPVHMGDFFFLNNRKFGKKFAACGGPGWNNPPTKNGNEQTLGWTMCPPGFGLWQRVWLEFRPAAFVSDIFVAPVPDRHEAHVSVEVTRTDPAAAAPPATDIRYALYGQNFKLTLAEGQTLSAGVRASEVSPGVSRYQFTVPMPEAQLRWWSHEEPWLYQIQVSLTEGGRVTDARKRQFGMKTFAQSLQGPLKGRFYLNGKEIKLRGANMMGNLMNCVMKGDLDQLRDDILLAKITHMTYWRMTQQPCQEEVYDYFDRLGLLAQTDMPVFTGYRKDQAEEGLRQLKAMVRLVRSHACNGVITYCNEPTFKPEMLDRKGHKELFNRFDAAALELNPTQVIKWIDGDFVDLSSENDKYPDHHNYGGWYGSLADTYWGNPGVNAGWMRGCGEFGAEGLDSVALMEKYYPTEWLEKEPDGTWTPDRIFRCQTPTTGRGWIGSPHTSMENFVRISREHQYWVIRLMTESMRRNPKMNSFAVHLLIDAWPNGWLKSIMDYDRQAKPAYFAYRDALTPLAVSLRPHSFFAYSGDPLLINVWVCNDTPDARTGTTLRYQVKVGGRVVSTGSAPGQVVVSSSKYQGNLKITPPEVDKALPMTVDVGLFDAGGKILHSSTVNIDLHPVADKPAKGQPTPREFGGAPLKLIRK